MKLDFAISMIAVGGWRDGLVERREREGKNTHVAAFRLMLPGFVRALNEYPAYLRT